jgi:hypothetical protein
MEKAYNSGALWLGMIDVTAHLENDHILSWFKGHAMVEYPTLSKIIGWFS